MALELEGKIVSKLGVRTGQSARGPWESQDFVLEYMDGSYPTSVCFSAFGNDKVQELAKYQVGDSVKVSFNIRGREYAGRWYNDLRIWKIAPLQGAAPSAPPQGYAQGYQAAQPAPSAPAYAAPQDTPPPPTFEDLPEDNPIDNDDLPF